MKIEAELRSKFLKRLRLDWPECVALRHEDTLQSGLPDCTLTANLMTSFVEFKHATPEFSGTGLQELTCCSLAEAGFCRYVVWFERLGARYTMVFHPAVVQASAGRPQARKPWLMVPECSTSGFNHEWLVNYFKQVHNQL